MEELNSTRYVVPHEMHEFQRDERYLFFDPVSFVWFQTDRLGKGVIDGLVRGNGDAGAAAAEVSRLSGAALDAAEPFARQTIDQLIEIGFLHRDEYRPREHHTGLLKTPRNLYLHMTARCNLKCPYCYNQENRWQIWKAPVGTFEQFKAVIDEAADLGFKVIKFTGGEALINKDTLPLARHARERGLWVNLLTNGLLVNEENAREIVEVANSVSISLDSADPEEHNVVRGKDTWRKVVRAIGLLREAGLDYLHLNSVVTPVNKDSIPEFLDFAWNEMGARKVTLAPTGIAVDDPDERWGAKKFMITQEDAWEIYRAQKAFGEREIRKNPPVIRRDSLRRTQCGVGNGLVSVDSNGDVYPCQTMHVPEMKCGNAFETGLRHVLETSGILKKAKNMTVDRLEDCPTCPMRYLCNGGCRMEAYSREGRLEARNRDMCPIFFNRALDKLWMSANLPVAEAGVDHHGRETPLEFLASPS